MSIQGVPLVIKAASAMVEFSSASVSRIVVARRILAEVGCENANLFNVKEHSRRASMNIGAEWSREQ